MARYDGKTPFNSDQTVQSDGKINISLKRRALNLLENLFGPLAMMPWFWLFVFCCLGPNRAKGHDLKRGPSVALS